MLSKFALSAGMAHALKLHSKASTQLDAKISNSTPAAASMLQTTASEPISNAQCYPGIARYYDTLEEAMAQDTGSAFEDNTFYGHDALFPQYLKPKQ